MSGKLTADFRLLGPLEVRLDGRLVAVGGRRPRCVLGILLLDAGHVVPLERLISHLWPDPDPPRTARNAVHVCVSRLRTCLGPAAPIVTCGDGYRIEVDRGSVDVFRFRAFDAAGRGTSGAAAIANLRQADALWRGPALHGTFDDWQRQRLCAGLDEERVAAAQLRFELELAQGDHASVAGELAQLIRVYPHHERLVELLMIALYRDGRAAQALEVFRDFSVSLAQDLGLDPGPALAATELAILRRSPALDRQPAADPDGPPPTPEEPVRVAQLPAAIADFTGREAALAELDRCAAAAAVAPLLLTGGAGVGKTALAVHWVGRYCVEQGASNLYVNLRGHSADPPRRPVDALSYLLRSMGVAPEAVPVDEAEAAGLYRSVLADRHVVVVLDNAYGASQVRPLLPGPGASFAVITSRERLGGLIARDGAQRVRLERFSETEAVALITRMIGVDQVEAAPRETRTLARLCGHLPLALRVAAANIVDGRYASIVDLVADVNDAAWPAALDLDDDTGAGTRVAFDHSYSRLDTAQQHMFRLLSVIPGPDFTTATAAAVSSRPVAAAGADLRRLTGAHLIEPAGPDRLSLHDLVHRYARSVSESTDAVEVRRQARERLYRHYLSCGDAAARIAYPQIVRMPWADDGTPAEFADAEAAMRWLDAERPGLLAAIHAAATDGDPRTAAALADMLRGYFSIRRLMSDWLSVADVALRSAGAIGDPAGEVAARLSLSMARWWLGQHAEAVAVLSDGAGLAESIGWMEAAVSRLCNLGGIYGDWGRLTEAADCLAEALRLHPADEVTTMRASILANLGAVYRDIGRLDAGIAHSRLAARLFATLGVELGAARAQANVGEALLSKGDLEAAAEELGAAAATLRRLPDRYAESSVLNSLAQLHLERGDAAEAAESANAALKLAEEIDAKNYTAASLSVLAAIERDPARHREAIAVARAGRAGYAEADARYWLADTLRHLGQLAAAGTECDKVLAVARDAGYRHIEATTLALRAEIHAARGSAGLARATAVEALAALTETGCLRHRDRMRDLARQPRRDPVTHRSSRA